MEPDGRKGHFFCLANVGMRERCVTAKANACVSGNERPEVGGGVLIR